MITLRVSHSQHWLLTRALVMLSSDEGADRLLSEFPNLDRDALAQDFDTLVDILAGRANARKETKE